jgi:hypothetical protein
MDTTYFFIISSMELYTSSEYKRKDVDNIHGQPQNVAIFLEVVKAKYKDTLTTYPKKTILLKTYKNIGVYGTIPMFKSISPNQATIPFAAILVQKWGYGFYHFVNEILPKIIRVFEYDATIPIIIFYNSFIKNILTYLGITNPIISYDRPCMCKEAIMITDTESGNPSPNDIALIRKYVRFNPVEKQVIVLIYRKEKQRHISNFDEIYNGLQTKFPNEKIVVFDSLPFEETVQLFQSAKLIIGAHGAGLSNMIFGSKAPIIEIFPENMFNACYWHLSWILENPHLCLVTDTSFKVDTEELYKAIYMLIEKDN